MELILQERGSAQEMFAFENKLQRRQDLTKEFLASPVIFLRKWMGEVKNLFWFNRKMYVKYNLDV